MVDFSSDNKVEMGKFFDEGLHTVKILNVTTDKNANGKEYIEFVVVGGHDEEGNARMYLSSDKAIKFTFNTIRGIFVHNALKGREDAARDMVNKVKDSAELVALCNKVLVGKEAFFLVEKSDYTYTTEAGEVKNGYNRNIYGYKPEVKAVPTTKEEQLNDAFPNSTPIPADEFPDVF